MRPYVAGDAYHRTPRKLIPLACATISIDTPQDVRNSYRSVPQPLQGEYAQHRDLGVPATQWNRAHATVYAPARHQTTQSIKEPQLHPSLRYRCHEPLSPRLIDHDLARSHSCLLATNPPLKAMTIEYVYPDSSRREISLDEDQGLTIGKVLAGAEELMEVDLLRNTCNDPYGTNANLWPRMAVNECPCSRRETYFEHLRMYHGAAGLVKSKVRDGSWELRLGQLTCKS